MCFKCTWLVREKKLTTSSRTINMSRDERGRGGGEPSLVVLRRALVPDREASQQSESLCNAFSSSVSI